MSIVKKISTALYNPLFIQYRYGGKVNELHLPKRAFNIEVSFSDEAELNSFLEACEYYLKKELIVFSEVKNEKALMDTAKKEKDKELKKVSTKADDNFAEIKDFVGLKKGGVDLVVEKSEPNQ